MALFGNDDLNKKILNTEFLEFKFGREDDKWDGQSVVRIWCDGRDYDESTEAYHPRYAYSIATPKFTYSESEIHGGANFPPNLKEGAQSLMAFLYACQEARNNELSENYDLFPEHVREWAYHYSDEIGMISIQLEAEAQES